MAKIFAAAALASVALGAAHGPSRSRPPSPPPLASSHPTPCDAAPVAAADEGTFFDLTAIDISGQPHPFEQYRGNVVLAVNVATD